MSPEATPSAAEPSLSHTLSEDLRRGNFWHTLHREFVELKEFSLDGDKRNRLAAMGKLRRHVVALWWILRGMILKLTPFRRLLLVAGLLLPLVDRSLGEPNLNFQFPPGIVLVLFVLLLELKDRLLSQDELREGKAVQQALLPDQTPNVDGWSLWISTLSANEVGGDLVDFLPVSPDRKGLVIADVSGKGLRAALLMAKLQTIVRSLAPDFSSLPDFVAKVNEVFRRECLPNIFASMIYAEITPGRHSIRLVNAGHLPPIRVSADGTHQLEKGETALGLLAAAHYRAQEIPLQQGDFLFCYSDGLTEACNQTGEFFGLERLQALLHSLRTLPAPDVGKEILSEISRFVGDAHPHDDLSMVVLKAI